MESDLLSSFCLLVENLMSLTHINDQFVSVNATGQVTFSNAGIERYRGYFGRVGVDIRNVLTYQDYVSAMRLIRPLLLAEHDQHAALPKDHSSSLQYQLIDAIVEDDTDKENRLVDKLSSKYRNLTIIK